MSVTDIPLVQEPVLLSEADKKQKEVWNKPSFLAEKFKYLEEDDDEDDILSKIRQPTIKQEKPEEPKIV